MDENFRKSAESAASDMSEVTELIADVCAGYYDHLRKVILSASLTEELVKDFHAQLWAFLFKVQNRPTFVIESLGGLRDVH